MEERVSPVPSAVAGTERTLAQSAGDAGATLDTAMEALFLSLRSDFSAEQIEIFRARMREISSSPQIIEHWRDTHNRLFHSDRTVLKSKSHRSLSRGCWAALLNPLWKPFGRRKPRDDRYSEVFLRSFDIELLIDERNQNFGTRLGVAAMIDYNTPCNLISPRLAHELGWNRPIYESSTPLVKTLGGVANTLGIVTGRWLCKNNLWTAFLHFDPKCQTSRFFVMEKDLDYDIIIGKEDIVRLDLMNLGGRLPSAHANGFRSKIPHVNQHTAANEQRQAEIARRLEEQQMQEDAEWRRRRAEDARVYAEERALQLHPKDTPEYVSIYNRFYQGYIASHPRS